MSAVDVIILIVLASFIIGGIKKGAFHEIMGFLGIVSGLIFGALLAGPVTRWLLDYIDFPRAFGYLVIFSTIFSGFVFLGRTIANMLKKMSENLFLGGVNKFVGGIIGGAKGAIIMSVVMMYISYLPIEDYLKKLEDRSALYPHIVELVPQIYDFLGSPDDLPDLLKNVLGRHQQKIIDDAMDDIQEDVEDAIYK